MNARNIVGAMAAAALAGALGGVTESPAPGDADAQRRRTDERERQAIHGQSMIEGAKDRRAARDAKRAAAARAAKPR